MVAEISGSTIIMISAIAVSLAAAAAMLDMVDTFEADTISNISIQVWDRFDASNYTWAEVTMTYPGGPLEISGDIKLCFVPADGATKCSITDIAPVPKCDTITSNQLHNCWSIKSVGSVDQLRFEGRIDLGFDTSRGDPLGYVVSGHIHDKSGTVGVR